MMFKSVNVQGYRSIEDSGELELGQITVVIGRNNAGKSSLVRALYLLQTGAPFQPSDIRIGQDRLAVSLRFDNFPPVDPAVTFNYVDGLMVVSANRNGPIEILVSQQAGGATTKVNLASAQEPSNLVHPVLASRTVTSFQQSGGRTHASNVVHTDSNIVARVRQLTGDFPEAVRFRQLCNDVLGLQFDNLDSDDGQFRNLGLSVDMRTSITLDAMGTGLGAVLNLLVSLSYARNKLILMEEPERDLHPSALKALLAAIATSAEKDNNQFVISTHSSTVLLRMGATPGAKVIYVQSDGAKVPRSTFEAVETPIRRIEVLNDLGYEISDFALAEGWAIFEESSAQGIIEGFLAPWFAPGLLRLRFLAGSGVSRVEGLTLNFKEMLMFAHLEPVYKGRAWVFVDGDDVGMEVVDRLRKRFSEWPPSQFRHWSDCQFEIILSSRIPGESCRNLC